MSCWLQEERSTQEGGGSPAAMRGSSTCADPPGEQTANHAAKISHTFIAKIVFYIDHCSVAKTYFILYISLRIILFYTFFFSQILSKCFIIGWNCLKGSKVLYLNFFSLNILYNCISNTYIFQAIFLNLWFFTQKLVFGWKYLYVSHTLFILYLDGNHTLFREKLYFI